MNILHTADWHIGKRLHGHELAQDHELYFKHLAKVIKQEQIDVLIVAGDVFDLANPSAEARQLYYNTLVQLRTTDCKIIISGGNHDSPAMLNAPRELLRALNIHVTGGLENSPDEYLVPVPDKENPQLVVAAVPYLRDAELRKQVKGETHDQREEAVREGIKRVFQAAAERCKALYPNTPAVAAGHLFAHGASTSESERDIQIGNLAGFETNQFPDYFHYIALGHIHKPQQAGAPHILYSGSPVPLSFSEKDDHKRMLKIKLKDGKVGDIKSLPVPQFRRLIKLSGSLQELKKQLAHPDFPQSELPHLLEVELKEPAYEAAKVLDFENLIDQFEHPGARIVKHRITFEQSAGTATEFYRNQSRIEELKPADVFEELLNRTGRTEDKELLTAAFHELYTDVTQNR